MIYELIKNAQAYFNHMCMELVSREIFLTEFKYSSYLKSRKSFALRDGANATNRLKSTLSVQHKIL